MLPELLTVPDSAPPYDYECVLHGTGCRDGEGEGKGGAPTAWRPATPPTPPTPTTSAAAPTAAVPASGDRGGTCAGTLWPRQFAQAIVETLAGLRPLRQLIGWTTEPVQARIRSLAPLLRTEQRPAIVRVLAEQPDAGVAEVTVIATFGVRTRALAMRFEHVAARPAALGLPGRPARWLCTAVESG